MFYNTSSSRRRHVDTGLQSFSLDHGKLLEICVHLLLCEENLRLFALAEMLELEILLPFLTWPDNDSTSSREWIRDKELHCCLKLCVRFEDSALALPSFAV